MREETVSINGVLYDSKTGHPVKKPAPTKATPKPAPKKVAVRQQKRIQVNATKPAKRKPAQSRTLNRQTVKKPVTARPTTTKAVPQKNKAAPQPRVSSPRTTAPSRQAPTQIMSRGVKRPKPVAVQKTTSKRTVNHTQKNESKKKKGVISAIVGLCLLIAIASVILTYLFVPSFSVWIASERSNVSATLPIYTPAGYKVSGAAESSPGMVTINYHSDSTDNTYALTQANSNWDSVGVLENKVKPLGGNHQTLSQKGLTIYRYSTGAVWVNGGILYTITDEGKLSNEQILQIVDGI